MGGGVGGGGGGWGGVGGGGGGVGGGWGGGGGGVGLGGGIFRGKGLKKFAEKTKHRNRFQCAFRFSRTIEVPAGLCRLECHLSCLLFNLVYG